MVREYHSNNDQNNRELEIAESKIKKKLTIDPNDLKRDMDIIDAYVTKLTERVEKLEFIYKQWYVKEKEGME